MFVALSLDIILGHYLFLEAYSFPRATLSENCLLLGTDNVRGQISKHILAPNEGYCLYIYALGFVKLNIFSIWRGRSIGWAWAKARGKVSIELDIFWPRLWRGPLLCYHFYTKRDWKSGVTKRPVLCKGEKIFVSLNQRDLKKASWTEAEEDQISRLQPSWKDACSLVEPLKQKRPLTALHVFKYEWINSPRFPENPLVGNWD